MEGSGDACHVAHTRPAFIQLPVVVICAYFLFDQKID